MKKFYTNKEILNMLRDKFNTYDFIAKNIGYSKSYTYEVLNGIKEGTLEFWSYCVEALELKMKPEEKATQIVALVQHKDLFEECEE